MNRLLSYLMAGVLFLCKFSDGRAQESAAQVRKFSFGTPTSVTRAGYTKVTVKDVFTSERG